MGAIKRGDRVEFVGKPYPEDPYQDDYVRPGLTGVVVDLEPPDDDPIVSWDGGGAAVYEESSLKVIEARSSE